jgi:hypothetical protein
MMEHLAKPGAQVFTSVAFRGPVALVRGSLDGEAADGLIGGMIARYSQDRLESYRIRKQEKGGEARFFNVTGPLEPEVLEGYRIGPKDARREKKGERSPESVHEMAEAAWPPASAGGGCGVTIRNRDGNKGQR